MGLPKSKGPFLTEADGKLVPTAICKFIRGAQAAGRGAKEVGRGGEANPLAAFLQQSCFTVYLYSSLHYGTRVH